MLSHAFLAGWELCCPLRRPSRFCSRLMGNLAASGVAATHVPPLLPGACERAYQRGSPRTNECTLQLNSALWFFLPRVSMSLMNGVTFGARTSPVGPSQSVALPSIDQRCLTKSAMSRKDILLEGEAIPSRLIEDSSIPLPFGHCHSERLEIAEECDRNAYS